MNKGVGILFVWAMLAQQAIATDAAILAEQCAKCHGINGYSEQPHVPIIAGFSQAGFVENINAFRNGDRVAIAYAVPGSPAIMMNEIARGLSDAQVEVLAAYYAGMPFAARHTDLVA